MSARSSNTAVTASTLPHAGFPKRLRRLARLVVGAYDRWLQRQALAELDDRLLKDIGLSRVERDRECGRPPWDGDAWR